MVRLADVDPGMRDFLTHLPCPAIDLSAWVPAKPANERRVALVSTAGLRHPRDRPFTDYASDYRILAAAERHAIIQDHLDASHDRTGYIQDLNTIFPLDRLDEMAADGEIGSVASYHYSFMGATSGEAVEAAARRLANILKADAVDTVLLCPV